MQKAGYRSCAFAPKFGAVTTPLIETVMALRTLGAGALSENSMYRKRRHGVSP
jgi:hypothetical protein